MNDSFEWDDDKNASNQRKHNISFDEAIQIFSGPILTNTRYHEESGELREFSLGFLGAAIVLAVAHTDRDGKIRIISARKATKSERKLFYDYIERTFG